MDKIIAENRYWINGQQQDYIPINDRAIQFGDGCFTTARIRNGNIDWLAAHLQRLHQGCQRLFITEVNWYKVEQEMKAVANTYKDGVLKVILTRGNGGHGYSVFNCTQPNRILYFSPWQNYYQRLHINGAKLILSQLRLTKNQVLAGIKHLNRLEQVLIRIQIDQNHADEALVLDTQGMIVECCSANIFWRKKIQVFTPCLNDVGIKGIMRHNIITLLYNSKYEVQEVQESMETLTDADEVIITNAVMPVLPVCQIGNCLYQSRELYNMLITNYK
ncbi:MAG: aminodeoxychorismate lyase [Candidatus Dasytiphilus stammeri]